MHAELSPNGGSTHARRIIRPWPSPKWLLALVLAMPSVLPPPTARSETTNLTLALYLVADKKTDDARFFDAFPFPKLGYIASKPDLVIAHLEEVILEAKPESPGALELTNGQTRRITVHHAPRLSVTLLPEDAARLKALAAGAPGRRVLVMFGESPIGLTRVSELGEHPIFTVAHNPADEASLTKLAHDLDRLVVPTLKGFDKSLNDRKTWLDADEA